VYTFTLTYIYIFIKFVCEILDTGRLAKIPNTYVMCSIQTHQQLSKVAHLFPENCFIGQKEMLPGVVTGGQKHPKSGGKKMSFL